MKKNFVRNNLNPVDRLVKSMQRMRKLGLAHLPVGNQDLTISQMQILAFIFQSPECHLQDIAVAQGISPPTASVAVKRLVESGWVLRNPDPHDGRATCFSLTHKSKSTIKRGLLARNQVLKIFFSGLTVPEQDQLLTLLERAVNSVEAHQQN
ncbi:MAG: MarR family transcriptional regulator [Chloroflexota bacterium]